MKQIKFPRVTAGLLSLMLIGVLQALPTPASAYQAPFTWSEPVANVSSATLPSGVAVTVATTGKSTLDPNATIGARGYSVSEFSPALAADAPALTPMVNVSECKVEGLCTDLGTITVTFSRPVLNPVLHFAGVGGFASWTPVDATGTIPLGKTRQSEYHAIWTLATPGVTLTQLAGNGQLTVSGGNVVTDVNDGSGISCTDTDPVGSYPSQAFSPAATAGCGSVQANGVVTSLTFNMSAMVVKNPNADVGYISTGTDLDGKPVLVSSDVMQFSVTAQEDLSDAPVSYNGAAAPSHTPSDIRLGRTVDTDVDSTKLTTLTSATALASVAAGESANGAAGDGADEDAFVSLPDVVSGLAASPYALTVPVSGVSQAGQLCGWIDFDANGVFDPVEQACAALAKGASSAMLSWTPTANLPSGLTYARFRVGYNTSQVQVPTGWADSGEVEDYSLMIVTPVASADPNSTSTPMNTPVMQSIFDNDTFNGSAPTDVKLGVPPGAPSGSSVSVDGHSVTLPGIGVFIVVDPVAGTVRFVPDAKFTGTTPAIPYTVSLANGLTPSSTVTVTITPVSPTVTLANQQNLPALPRTDGQGAAWQGAALAIAMLFGLVLTAVWRHRAAA